MEEEENNEYTARMYEFMLQIENLDGDNELTQMLTLNVFFNCQKNDEIIMIEGDPSEEELL